jgi:DNA-binding response OmpR family regulator
MNILLVEHQAALIARFKEDLECHGCAVHLARNDLEAQAESARRTFDSILVDCSIPSSGGVSLVRGMRHAGSVTPIVMLLRSHDSRGRVECLDAGADNCVVEGVAVQELLALMRALSRRHHGLPGVIRVGDLEIDTGYHTVNRSGKAIKLTRREYDLLELLARHRGVVLTRSEIHGRIYGPAANRHSNIIDVYVRYLRRKIDQGFDTPLILTCRGKGYMFRNGAT